MQRGMPRPLVAVAAPAAQEVQCERAVRVRLAAPAAPQELAAPGAQAMREGSLGTHPMKGRLSRTRLRVRLQQLREEGAMAGTAPQAAQVVHRK